jgi:hypothetical protein
MMVRLLPMGCICGVYWKYCSGSSSSSALNINDGAVVADGLHLQGANSSSSSVGSALSVNDGAVVANRLHLHGGNMAAAAAATAVAAAGAAAVAAAALGQLR